MKKLGAIIAGIMLLYMGSCKDSCSSCNKNEYCDGVADTCACMIGYERKKLRHGGKEKFIGTFLGIFYADTAAQGWLDTIIIIKDTTREDAMRLPAIHNMLITENSSLSLSLVAFSDLEHSTYYGSGNIDKNGKQLILDYTVYYSDTLKPPVRFSFLGTKQ